MLSKHVLAAALGAVGVLFGDFDDDAEAALTTNRWTQTTTNKWEIRR